MKIRIPNERDGRETDGAFKLVFGRRFLSTRHRFVGCGTTALQDASLHAPSSFVLWRDCYHIDNVLFAGGH